MSRITHWQPPEMVYWYLMTPLNSLTNVSSWSSFDEMSRLLFLAVLLLFSLSTWAQTDTMRPLPQQPASHHHHKYITLLKVASKKFAE